MNLDMNPLHYATEIKTILATAFFPALAAWIKSELMALDASSTANGIIQFFLQARAANRPPQTQRSNEVETFLQKLEETAARIEELGPKMEAGLDHLAKTVERFAPLLERFAPLFGKDGQAVASAAGVAGQVATLIDDAIPDQTTTSQ